jgi:hypothetical protein
MALFGYTRNYAGIYYFLIYIHFLLFLAEQKLLLSHAGIEFLVHKREFSGHFQLSVRLNFVEILTKITVRVSL